MKNQGTSSLKQHFLHELMQHMHGAFKEAVSLNDVAINQVSQDDNVATGSSYQYVDWSKPSKDGWMAVQNPNLRMFSQVLCHITKEPFFPKHLNIEKVG